jgi:hypothetical protein
MVSAMRIWEAVMAVKFLESHVATQGSCAHLLGSPGILLLPSASGSLLTPLSGIVYKELSIFSFSKESVKYTSPRLRNRGHSSFRHALGSAVSADTPVTLMCGSTRLHHHLGRGPVDILLKACSPGISK